MFSTVIATRQRPQMLQETLAALAPLNCPDIVIVVNDCAQTTELLKTQRDAFTVIDLDENIGAGRGKQLGIEATKHNHVLVLDDDALVLDGSDLDFCLEKLKTHALVQGLILADAKGARRSFEQPFWFRKSRQGEHELSYFVGAVHFINKADFLAANGYRQAARYGFEELELSLNLLANGKKLIFTDKFRVHHKRHPSGRAVEKTVLYEMLQCRNRISATYFPRAVAMICQLVWNIKLLPKTRRISFHKGSKSPKFGYRDLARTPRLLSRAFA